MSSTSTSRLGLFKPVPGSAEPFRTSDLNSNWDKVDAEAVAADGRLDVLELAVGASGSVVNATNATNATNASSANSATLAGKATNIAGGLQKQIPIQSAADTTTFVAAPSAGGKVLASTLSAPYAAWTDAVPYRVQSGVISSGWSSGVATVSFNTAFDSGIVPIVVLTTLSANTSLITSATLSSAPTNTGFSVTARTYNGSSFAAGSPTVHWIAIQYSSTSASS